MYALANGKNLKFDRNDKRVNVKCVGAKGKCKWYAYCTYMFVVNSWQLRKIIDNHSSNREDGEEVTENPHMKIMDIRDKDSRKWNVGISRNMAFSSKAIARDIVDGSFA